MKQTLEAFFRFQRLLDNRVLCLDYLLHSIAFALNNHGFGVVKEAIQQRRSEGTVVVEDFGLVFESPVSSDNQRAFKAFEEGIKLARLCASKLDEAQRRVDILLKQGEELVIRPFQEGKEQ